MIRASAADKPEPTTNIGGALVLLLVDARIWGSAYIRTWISKGRFVWRFPNRFENVDSGRFRCFSDGVCIMSSVVGPVTQWTLRIMNAIGVHS